MSRASDEIAPQGPEDTTPEHPADETRLDSLHRHPVGSRASWMIPASLLLLFVVTAFATRLVKEKTYKGRSAGGGDIAQEPVQGGVFRYPILSPFLKSDSLDPAQAVYDGEVMLVQQLYDGLTGFDKHLNIVPALAKFWEISPDGRTYTFELREDASFHNGRRVTAEDCVFSFERLLTPGLNDHNYHYYSRIEGAVDFHEGRAQEVSGLRAISEHRFQIRFTTPFVPALSVLSMYSSKILPKKEILEQGEEAFFRAPIGTGAFRFSRWIEPTEDPAVPVYNGVPHGIRFEANDDYFAGRPYLDAVVFRALLNAPGFGDPPPVNMVADCIEDVSAVQSYGDWVPVEAKGLLALRYLYFPNRVPPYDDPRVRQALNYALDKRSFIDSSSGTAGAAAATGIVPPGIPGFIPLNSHYSHDLEKARALLAEAGYPSGRGLPPLEVLVPRGAIGQNHPIIARDSCLVACLSNVGVEVELVEVDGVIDPTAPRYRGRPIVADEIWLADFPDPDNFLRPLFHSQGPINRFGYRNEKVDRLLDQVWTETSYTARSALYHKIEKIILDDAPIIPTDYDHLRYLLRPNVRGFTLTPLGSAYLKMKDIWLAEEGPEPEVEL